MALHPVVDLLKRMFAIDEGDPAPAVAAKIEATVGRFGDDLGATRPYLRYTLSVDADDPRVTALAPAELRSELFDALRRLLIRTAQDTPQVVLVEDLHWVDAATEDFLRFVGDSIPASRILLILTYRPGYVHPLGERTHHTRIGLGSLSTEESARMARTMLSVDDLPHELRGLITARAEGNPFYLEELVKTLTATGAIERRDGRCVLTRVLHDRDVPATVQDVIMARVDRLAPASRRTLQLAAVIGRQFPRRLVDRLADVPDPMDRSLRDLVALELIHERSVFPEVAYSFNHALTHEVAYASLLREHRKVLHGRVGEAVEALYADRLTEHYEVLAHHFARAERWDVALTYLEKAHDKAAKAFAVRDALALTATALEAIRALGAAVAAPRVMALHRARHDYHFAVADYAAAVTDAEQWLYVAGASHDRNAEAMAHAAAAHARFWAEDFPGARQEAQAAIAMAEATDNTSALALSHLTLGFMAAVTAQFDESARRLDRGLVVSRHAKDVASEALMLQTRALVPNWQGDYDGAAALIAEALRLAREHNLLNPLLRSLWFQGIVLTGQGAYDAALAVLTEGLALSEKIGDESSIPRCLNTLGWLHAECGSYGPALELSERAAMWARRRRHATSVERTAFVAVVKADVFMAQGDVVLAGDALQEARRIVEAPETHEWMKWRYELRFHIAEGEYWLARGDPRRAAASCARGLAQAAATGSRKYLARAWRLKAEIALAERDWATAHHDLAEALAVARAVRHPPQLWMTHAAIGRLHDAQGDAEAASHAYAAARDVLTAITTGLRDPGLRAALERDPGAVFVRERAR